MSLQQLTEEDRHTRDIAAIWFSRFRDLAEGRILPNSGLAEHPINNALIFLSSMDLCSELIEMLQLRWTHSYPIVHDTVYVVSVYSGSEKAFLFSHSDAQQIIKLFDRVVSPIVGGGRKWEGTPCYDGTVVFTSPYPNGKVLLADDGKLTIIDHVSIELARFGEDVKCTVRGQVQYREFAEFDPIQLKED